MQSGNEHTRAGSWEFVLAQFSSAFARRNNSIDRQFIIFLAEPCLMDICHRSERLFAFQHVSFFLQNSLRSSFEFTSPGGRKSSIPNCSRENLRFLTVLDCSDESASGMSFTSGCISTKTTENHSSDHLLYLFLQEQQPSPEQ